MTKIIYSPIFFVCFLSRADSQLKWVNLDSLYGPLPASVHVFRTTGTLDGKPNIAYYLIADLKDKDLLFNADTTHKRRFTPSQFFLKNNQPLVVVNCTFFSFQTNQNLNVVIKDGKTVAYNIHAVKGKGNDSLLYYYRFGSAFGINLERKPDIAWLYTDSSKQFPLAMQLPICGDWRQIGSNPNPKFRSKDFKKMSGCITDVMMKMPFEKEWKMQTAVGGGPVLLQWGELRITNNDELMFAGKAINDKHPRTAMGYTKDNKLIILVIQGRFPGIAEGASLTQEAKILK